MNDVMKCRLISGGVCLISSALVGYAWSVVLNPEAGGILITKLTIIASVIAPVALYIALFTRDVMETSDNITSHEGKIVAVADPEKPDEIAFNTLVPVKVKIAICVICLLTIIHLVALGYMMSSTGSKWREEARQERKEEYQSTHNVQSMNECETAHYTYKNIQDTHQVIPAEMENEYNRKIAECDHTPMSPLVVDTQDQAAAKLVQMQLQNCERMRAAPTFRKEHHIELPEQGREAEAKALAECDQLQAAKAQPQVIGSSVSITANSKRQQCEQMLTDNANKLHIDPVAYTAANQVWIQQCMQPR